MKFALPRAANPSPFTRFFLPALLLPVALALRLYLLDAQSFWADEVLSVWHVKVPLATLLAALPVDHTPGYWVLLHFWLPLGGDVDFSLRFFSVWWGVLSVALVCRLGRQLFSPRVGLAAAALMALNPFAVYQSQETRMYTQLLAFGALSLLAFARAYARPSRRNWLLHMLAVAGALYTHYYGLSLVLAEGAFMVLEWRGQGVVDSPAATTRAGAPFSPAARWGWFLSVAGVVVLFLPWMPHLLQLLRTQTWQPPVDPLTYPAQVYGTFLAGTGLPIEAVPWLAGLAFLVLAAGARAVRGTWQGRLLILASAVPVALIPVALALRGQGLFVRYLIPLLPAFLLLAASGLQRRGLSWPLVSGAVLALLLGVSLLSLNNLWFDPHYSRPGWAQAARFVAEHQGSGDLVLVEDADPKIEFARYYRGAAPVLGAPDPKRAARFETDMTRITAQSARVWLVVLGGNRDAVEDWLNQKGFEGDYEEYAGVYVYPFVMSSVMTPAAPPAEVIASSGIDLLEYRVGGAQPASYLPVALSWRNGPARQDTPLQVSLRLLDASGRVVVTLDRAPRAGLYPITAWQPRERVPDNYALWLRADLPSGTYTLSVLLYDPDGGDPVLQATLGPVTVSAAR